MYTIFKDCKHCSSGWKDELEAKGVSVSAQALVDLCASNSTALVKEKEMGSILNKSVMEENGQIVKQVYALQHSTR